MLRNTHKHASALVTTLFVLVVLCTITVAFLQTMTMERAVSRSLKNKFKADLAAEAGANMVAQAMTEAIGTHAGFLVLSTNISPALTPIFYIQTGSNDATSNVLPLVSGDLTNYLGTRSSSTSALTDYLAQATNTNNAINANKLNGNYRILANSGPTNFNAPWIHFTNANGETNSRVAFFVVDEQSKLNLAHHGWSTNTNRAGWSNSPSLVPIAIPGNTNLLTTNAAVAFASATNKSHFVGNLAQIFSDRADYESKKHLYTYATGPSQDFIPSGYTNINGTFSNYAQAHLPKWNINNLASNISFGTTASLRASNIAQVINTNLPNFGKRDIAMSNGLGGSYFRYLERISASILDYIDSDTDVTILPDASPLGEPAGKELAPLVTGIAEKYNWISESGSGTAWTNKITQTVFVQLWNPYQTNLSGNLSLEVTTYRPIKMPGLGSQILPNAGTIAINNLRPNEMKVFKTATVTNTVISTLKGSALVGNRPYLEPTASANAFFEHHSRFDARWNGVLFDRTANLATNFFTNNQGLPKSAMGKTIETRINLGGPNRFAINYPSCGYFAGPKGYRAVADPRQNAISPYDWEAPAPTNSEVRWNGRNTFTNESSQDYANTFSSRDVVRASPLEGASIDLTLADPTSAASSYSISESTNAPFYLRNAKMESIGELGNIYDPAQLNDVGFSTAGSDSWYASGGGRTLRMGIPEFDYPASGIAPSGSEKAAPNWSSPGFRSLHLVDLFTIAETNASGIPTRAPKININTAPKEVLTALFYHLSQNADPAFTNSSLTSHAATQLANLVISNRPYYNLSDLHKITPQLLNPTNFIPTLGSNSSTPIATIHDAGREQVLSSLLELVDTQSRNFKVVAIGQALGPSGKVLSESILEVDLILDSYPQTNSSGGVEYRTRAIQKHSKKH